MSFVRTAFPIWQWEDPVTGLPLNDMYWVSFLTNVFPYVPQFVYQDNQGMTAWSDPIQLTSAGELPNNLYFNSAEVYRIEVRMGPTQNDPLLYVINDFVPVGSGISPTPGSSGIQDNQITNPQFAFIDFVSPLTITTAGTYDVAPGWSLILTGSGTATVTQVISSGSQSTPTAPVPPYYLEFNLANWTTAILQQQFNGNGALWNNQYVSMSVLARSNTGAGNNLTLTYAPSSGNPVQIASSLLTYGVFGFIQGVVAIPQSTNATLNNLAFVDIQITLPNAITDISDVTIMGQTNSTVIPASQLVDETIEQQTDSLFHYYKNSILIQPKDTLVSGWNFALNPWQFTTTTSTNVATNKYTADQTIVIQQNYVATATGNNVAVGQAPAFNYALQITGVTAANQFGLLQYIAPLLTAPYFQGLSYSFTSALVRAYIVTSHSSAVKFKMRLLINDGNPMTVSQTEPVASWTAGGDPIFNSSNGWSGIAPLNDPVYTLTTTPTDYAFNAFPMPNSGVSTVTVGVLFYTVSNMNQASPPDSIMVNEISLVPNRFAIESNPLTYDQVLRRCQHYYETSYQSGAALATVTNAGLIVAPQHIVFVGGSQWSMPYGTFGHTYAVKKVSSGTLTTYSPITANSGGSVRAIISSGATQDGSADIALSGGWNAGTLSASGFYFTPGNAGATVTSSASYTANSLLSGALYYHFSADARLGR